MVPPRAWRPPGTRFAVKPGHINRYFSDAGFDVLRRLREISEATSIPMVRLAMANPDVTSVLAGARSTEHIDNALQAEGAAWLYDLVLTAFSQTPC